ncbi:substrate-binding periplasmic protein [Pseudogulbenkiania subflava]|uniref:Amino acid ABC transporter substrate-binding protein, PAAT family n=1 Tax=Pseudogulbenkiania subflava DSM 22618 TaxID=1123014 RepID=A0A1Y6BA59_9NEIS|nr:transporter substrate-binding domain-containing protein [Pseudogulbenkiania subflava]SME93009.1 amino acid ABC transporter substrate-binding protein, PAAT family [Pseudogulbenkiania subflava DSM 22618]
MRVFCWMLSLPLWLLASGHVVAAAELHVAVGLAKPPYVEEGGQGGMEVEIVRAALQQAGFKPVFEVYPQARGLMLLQSGHIDAMLTLAPDSPVDAFRSAPVLYYRNRAIVLKSSGIRLNSVADLVRHSVAGFQNARLVLGPDFTAVTADHPRYTELADQQIQNRLLYLHRVEVVVGDSLVFHQNNRALGKHLDTSAELVEFDLFPPSPRSVGFLRQEQRDAFDRALKTLQRSGEVARIVARYRAAYGFD